MPEWYHPSGDMTDDILPKADHRFVPVEGVRAMSESKVERLAAARRARDVADRVRDEASRACVEASRAWDEANRKVREIEAEP